MQLQELVNQVTSFDAFAPKDKIKLLAWWLHTHGDKELFVVTDVRNCFSKLHIDEPPALATYLTRMAAAKPADLLVEKGRFKLTRNVRTELDKKYGVHHSVVAVSKILTDLPAMIPNVAEREFLNEALKCYRVESYRACVVMMWNLAYAHLLDWILRDAGRLVTFNAAISKRYPKLISLQIIKYEDFLDELKESQVIEICNKANLIDSNKFKILSEKLVKRNIAAHPSNVKIVQSQADDVVTDLVNNVVLQLA